MNPANTNILPPAPEWKEQPVDHRRETPFPGEGIDDIRHQTESVLPPGTLDYDEEKRQRDYALGSQTGVPEASTGGFNA